MLHDFIRLNNINPFGERRIYRGSQGTAGEQESWANATAETVNPWEGEEGKKESAEYQVEEDFARQLGERNGAIKEFVTIFKESEPPMSMEDANARFAKLMGQEKLSYDAQKGLVRVLQRYLNKYSEAKLEVDGYMGSKTVNALANRKTEQREINSSMIQNPWDTRPKEERKGWVEGITRYAFADEGGAKYFLTYNGDWIDNDHHLVDPVNLMPRIGKEIGSSKIYELPDGKGGKLFCNAQGKEVQPYYNNSAMVQYYFRLDDGSWIDKDGNPKELKAILPDIATLSYVKDKKDVAYEVFENGKTVVYDTEGNKINFPAPDLSAAGPTRVAEAGKPYLPTEI